MSALEVVTLSLAAGCGGALNSIAGGGSFLTFPALVYFGLTPLSANATSTAALWPGSVASSVGYRRELAQEGRLLVGLAAVSLLGGTLGAVAVVATPPTVFVRVVPFLLLAATLIFTAGERLRQRLEGAQASTGLVVPLQFGVALYGGYFGGGMGLMMLALFSLLGARGLHAINGLKSLLGVAINLAALLTFVASGQVDWPRGAMMGAAAVVGGFGGAALARRVQVARVKQVVVVIAWAMTAAFFYRTYISATLPV